MMENIQKALAKFWGYDGFLPLQKQAMECISRPESLLELAPRYFDNRGQVPDYGAEICDFKWRMYFCTSRGYFANAFPCFLSRKGPVSADNIRDKYLKAEY